MVLVITFLLDTVVGFLTMLLLLRFLMQLNRVSFANPVGNFVVQITNWLVTPLRRVIPGVMGLDLASLVPAWLLQCRLLWVVYYLRSSLVVIDDGMLVLLVLWRGLMATLRIAMIFTFTAVMIAEMYASRTGIGHMIANWGENFQMRQLFAGVILLAVVAILFNETIRWLETRCSTWRT